MSWKSLTSRQAYHQLHLDAKRVLNVEEQRLMDLYGTFAFSFSLSWIVKLRHSLANNGNYCSSYSFLLLLCTVLLVISDANKGPEAGDLVAATAILIYVVLNVCLSSFDIYRRNFEMFHKAEEIVRSIEKMAKREHFEYFSSEQPDCETISLQLTIRDNQVCNVPRLLLARGDVILIRAGHLAPCLCISYDGKVFKRGQMIPFEAITCTDTDAVIPMVAKRFAVLETPLTSHMNDAFKSHAMRSQASLDSKVFKSVHLMIECFLLPVFLFLVTAVLIIRYTSSFPYSESLSYDVSILAVTILPLLLPAFPSFYMLIKFWNLAYVICKAAPAQHVPDTLIPSPIFHLISQHRKVTPKEYYQKFFEIVEGRMKSNYMSLASDLVFNMGSVTTVAFIDKNGILSWPNATAEKIAFFHKCRDHKKVAIRILNISLAQQINLQFDSPNWSHFRRSLLPVVAAAVQNPCAHLATMHRRFHDHLMAVQNQVRLCRCADVPRHHCICKLAHIISSAHRIQRKLDLSTIKTIGVYQRVPLNSTATSFGTFKHGIAIENGFITVVREQSAFGHYQIMSQGSQIVLDGCAYAWNGMDAAPLESSDYAKLLDFYERSCVTGYCTVIATGANGSTLSERMSYRYIDLSPFHPRDAVSHDHVNTHLPQALSVMNLCDENVQLNTARHCIDSLLKGQIFCAIIAMRNQARKDAVQLIEQLDNAYVRFTFFSTENELRTRMFAVQLGLEAGWNCHVSLACEGSDQWQIQQQFKRCTGHDKLSYLDLALNKRLSNHYSYFTGTSNLISRSQSLIELSTSPVSNRRSSTNKAIVHDAAHQSNVGEDIINKSIISSLKEEVSLSSSSNNLSPQLPPLLPNVAGLPSGIENIRSHLKTVDNVPLLVNLFTDCDYKTDAEMIKVMKEYGETVLVVGSALNADNTNTFNQADCSICIEPQYPSVCCDKPSAPSELVSETATNASTLMHIATNILFVANQKVDMLSMITESRRRVRLTRSAILFFLHSSIAVAITQLFSLLIFMPPLFSAFQMFLFTFVYIPIIALSLTTSSKYFDDCYSQISPKNAKFTNFHGLQRMLGYLSSRFLPSVLSTVFTYAATVVSNYIISPSDRDDPLSGEDINDAAVFTRFLFTVYICIVSSSFVFIHDTAKERLPFENKCWVIACCVTLLIQMLITISSMRRYAVISAHPSVTLSIVVSLILILFFNEFHKHKMVLIHRRLQRRSKLSFNTKLGMNSPY